MLINRIKWKKTIPYYGGNVLICVLISCNSHHERFLNKCSKALRARSARKLSEKLNEGERKALITIERERERTMLNIALETLAREIVK